MRIVLPALFLLASLAAQDRDGPRFRINLGLAGGNFDYTTDGSALQGDTDAGMFRLQFEGTSARGVGGGVRLESFASDDDLFDDAGFPGTEATGGTVFPHFTYRVQAHRFAMPLRIGPVFNSLKLEDDASNSDVTFSSFGIYFEVAPEIVLIHGGRTTWSVYGELGFGGGATEIELEGAGIGIPEDYDSSTSFFGLELGTRVTLGSIELGLAFVGRWQEMDESDPEGGFVVLGYDAEFTGAMFSLGVIF